MHGGLTLQTFNGTLQGSNAPVIHFIKEDVKGRLVKLNNVHARRFQLSGFLVENFGKFPGQFFPAFIVTIIEGIDHGHGAGQRPFNGFVGLLAQKFGVFHKHRFLTAHRTHHRRHTGVVAITDFNGSALFKIHPVEVFNKGGDKVLTGLLAVAHNVDAGGLLLLQRYPQRILLAVDQLLPFQLPG